MRVLVTGGAGFIGSVTASALVERGHDVVVLDDLRSGYRDAVPTRAAFVEGDVRDGALVASILADGVDACVHFAALIEAGESMRHPERFFHVNTGGSAALLEQLLDHGVERFVLSSTAAVYGEPATVPIPETATLEPTNAYGASKLLVEQMLAWLGRLRGLRHASLRYFNAAGAVGALGERHRPETHLVPLVLEVAEGRRDAVSVFGTDYPTPDGTAVRDYVHVADLARAHVLALEALDHREAITCNLGTGAGASVREVVEAARRVTGHPIPVVEEGRRPGDPAVLVAAADRARELLGWRAQWTGIDDVVASAWTFRQDHLEVTR